MFVELKTLPRADSPEKRKKNACGRFFLKLFYNNGEGIDFPLDREDQVYLNLDESEKAKSRKT